MSPTPVLPKTKRTQRPYPGGEPVWDLAYLYPPQGKWSEEAYLALPGGMQVEYKDGFVEVLPTPTMAHQFIVLYLYRLLNDYVLAHRLGWVLVAPLPVRLRPRVYREPDVVFLSADRPERLAEDYPDGADLVMEVVSGGREDRRRDWVVKRAEYAAAGISEYWIIDPDERIITVLRLEGGEYVEQGRFTDEAEAPSALLPGFAVPVTEVWAAAAG